jgi:DNA-binding winged helix-turn-helix (wHTH) protein
MKDPTPPPSPVRFGVFELNRQTGELRKQGLKVKLTQQVRRLLTVLLERPGQLCSREQLRQRLWASDTFVAFDHSLNKAVHVLREVLGDSALSPRYIETVAGQGYRFIALAQDLTARFPLRKKRSRKVKLVALLPLNIEPAEPEMEFLNKRILESVIDFLSRATGLRVLAYHTVSHYQWGELDPSAVGGDLQVDAVVVGEMTRRDDELLLHMELIDVSDGTQLWGAQFSECWSDASGHPDKVADKISKRLWPILTAKKDSSFRKSPMARAAESTPRLKTRSGSRLSVLPLRSVIGPAILAGCLCLQEL